MAHTTPRQKPPAALTDLTRALRHLHKALLDKQAADYGYISGPLQLLDLATNHPQFAWLRKLSEVMADIDERTDDTPVLPADDVAAIKKTLRGLIGPDDPSAPVFREHYLAAMQQSPEIAMAHARVREALNAW